MTLNEIIERNYQATIRRGKITPTTTEFECFDDIMGECEELRETLGDKITRFDVFELADIILTCHTMGKQFGYDMEKILIKKTLYNETRE